MQKSIIFLGAIFGLFTIFISGSQAGVFNTPTLAPRVETGTIPSHALDSLFNISQNQDELSVIGSDTDRIEYTVTFESKEGATAEELESCKVTKNPNALTIYRSSENIRTKAIVRVPRAARLQIALDRGILEVESLTGNVNLSLKSGVIDYTVGNTDSDKWCYKAHLGAGKLNDDYTPKSERSGKNLDSNFCRGGESNVMDITNDSGIIEINK